jgi:UPF0716 protein FxsA
MPKLALLVFVALPVLEVILLVRAAAEFGWWVLAYLLGAAALGAFVISREREAWAPRLMTAARAASPFSALFVTARRFLAGVLLILPGFISDAVALVLLLWPSHPAPKIPENVIEGEYRREDE